MPMIKRKFLFHFFSVPNTNLHRLVYRDIEIYWQSVPIKHSNMHRLSQASINLI